MKKENKIINLILKNPKTYIIAIFFDLLSACLSTLSSVRLTIFTQSIIEGKYKEAILIDMVNLLLFLGAVFCEYIYKIYQNRTIQHSMIIYRDEIAHVSISQNYDTLTSINSLNNDSARIEEAIRNIFIVTDAFIFVVVTIIALIYLHWSIMFFSILLFAINTLVPALVYSPFD